MSSGLGPGTGKARFQQGVKGASKGGASKVGPDSVVPGGKAFGGGGAISSNKPAIQVIYNGKIMTPQSLQYRPKAKTESVVAGEGRNLNIIGLRRPKAVADAEGEDGPKRPAPSKVEKLRSGVGGALGKKGVEELTVLTLSETDTSCLFFLNSFVVSNDAKDLALHDGRSAKYNSVVEAHKSADNFLVNSSQTLNLPVKAQNESTVSTTSNEMGSQALAFEINEATGHGQGESDLLDVGGGDAEDPAGLTALVRQFVTDSVNVALITPGCLLDPNDISRHQDKSSAGASGESGKKKKGAGKSGGLSGLGTSSVATGPLQVQNQSQPGPQEYPGGSKTPQIGDSLLTANQTVGAADSPQKQVVGHSQHSNVAASSATGAPGAAASALTASAEDVPSAVSEADSAAILFERRALRVLESEGLLKRLQMMERAVQQNAFMRQQLDYRDLPDVKPIALSKSQAAPEGGGGGFGGTRMTINTSAPLGLGGVVHGSVGGSVDSQLHSGGGDDASLGSYLEDGMRGPNQEVKRLYSYINHDLIQGRSVTTMVWNKVNQDLLAVGYGKLDSFVDPYNAGEALDEPRQGGLVLFWSLRNPEYPEKVLKTPSPVTALEFSRLSPMTLAVGCQSGDVLVFDVRRETDWGKPIESSSGVAGGHTDPVWQVKWVPRGLERIETLISVSSDGKVLQWTIKKGLLVSTLMRLARSGQSDGWISRQAAGLCFDFCPDDATTYVVGTEEGTLHRCSISYTEQYLETFSPHHGPVNRVRFSPKWPQLFLSCSSDWSLGLFHLQSKQPLFNMRAAGADVSITDVAWCPDNSTVFAAVDTHGHLQIWDLSDSFIDPVVSIDTTGDEISRTARHGCKGKNTIDVTSEDDDALLDPANVGTNTKLAPPAAPFSFKRRGEEDKDEPKEGRVVRLLKNLVSGPSNATDGPRRVLTCVNFSERAPVIVVGDNSGAVTVYRVLSPTLITHLGPLQQTEGLKAAVLGSADPTILALLQDNKDAATPSEEVKS